MSQADRDLAAEFRVFADALLDRVDPIIRRIDTSGGPEWQDCSWCPLCALAALIRGERHDLLTLLGGELDNVLTALRDALGEHGRRPRKNAPEPDESRAPAAHGRFDSAVVPEPPIEPDLPTVPDPAERTRNYVPIAVTITEP